MKKKRIKKKEKRKRKKGKQRREISTSQKKVHQKRFVKRFIKKNKITRGEHRLKAGNAPSDANIVVTGG